MQLTLYQQIWRVLLLIYAKIYWFFQAIVSRGTLRQGPQARQVCIHLIRLPSSLQDSLIRPLRFPRQSISCTSYSVFGQGFYIVTMFPFLAAYSSKTLLVLPRLVCLRSVSKVLGERLRFSYRRLFVFAYLGLGRVVPSTVAILLSTRYILCGLMYSRTLPALVFLLSVVSSYMPESVISQVLYYPLLQVVGFYSEEVCFEDKSLLRYRLSRSLVLDSDNRSRVSLFLAYFRALQLYSLFDSQIGELVRVLFLYLSLARLITEVLVGSDPVYQDLIYRGCYLCVIVRRMGSLQPTNRILTASGRFRNRRQDPSIRIRSENENEISYLYSDLILIRATMYLGTLKTPLVSNAFNSCYLLTNWNYLCTSYSVLAPACISSL